MNKNEQCFLHYLSCFLNSKAPQMVPDDWQELYKLSKINNVLGIVSNVVLNLPEYQQPNAEIKMAFVKALGKTVHNYDSKQKAQNEIESFLFSNKFDYAFVKGSAIRELYPAPELRTSGDIDVIVKPSNYDDIVEKLKDTDFIIEQVYTNVCLASIYGVEIEIHNDADDFWKVYSNEFFDLCLKNGNKYYLYEYNQLMYVLLHLVAHLKSNGAGIRMLMDLDVCIRAINDFDEDKFLKMCKLSGIEKCAEVLFSLIKLWFDTPIGGDLDIKDNEKLYNLLMKCFLNGGMFGKENNNLGSFYVSKVNNSAKIGFSSKLKAFFRMIFPPAENIKRIYPYVKKHPILIVWGYISHIFVGVFKNFKGSVKTVGQIAKSDESSLLVNQIVDELEINENLH